MEILVALGFAVAVVLLADRLMLALERRGHVNWRRTGRRKIADQPGADLDGLLEDGLLEDGLLEDGR
jgi:hypothetical protein